MNKKLLFLLLVCILICLVNVFAQEEIIYDDTDKRDPFIALVTPDGRLLDLRPAGLEAGPETKIVLEGIIYDEFGRSYAIINDEVVTIGDYILGHPVFKIDNDKVILLEDNKPVEYKLRKEKP